MLVKWRCLILEQRNKKKRWYVEISEDAIPDNDGFICDCGRWTNGKDAFHITLQEREYIEKKYPEYKPEYPFSGNCEDCHLGNGKSCDRSIIYGNEKCIYGKRKFGDKYTIDNVKKLRELKEQNRIMLNMEERHISSIKCDCCQNFIERNRIRYYDDTGAWLCKDCKIEGY